MMERTKGFLFALLDVSFSDYVTAKLIRAIYRITIIITVNGVVFAWLFAWWLPDWFGWGMKALIFLGAPATALMFLTISRLILEHLIVIYAIHDKLSAIDHNTRPNRKDNTGT
jgi:hypothetical protein